MSFNSAVLDRLSGQSSVTDVLGSSPMRVYFHQLPEGVSYPAARFFIVSTPPNAVHNGGGDGLISPSVQFDILAESAASVVAAADAIDAALNGFKASPLSGFRTNRVDAFEESGNYFRITMEYKLHYKTS